LNSQEVDIAIYDIEGCFPNMPQDGIMMALNSITVEFKKQGKKGVWVPFGDRQKCTWEQPKRGYGTWIPWDVMINITAFSLKNTFLVLPEGQILRQCSGIPMGNPLSPGITIGTCSWMEQEWLSLTSAAMQKSFKAARYMDDIMLIKQRNGSWDQELFMEECYWHPLKLEEAQQNTFLETRFNWQNNCLQCWLKNENEQETKIWRYHHFDSDVALSQKKTTLMSILRKVHRMCIGKEALYDSAICKVKEFIKLKYPINLCRIACANMARETFDTVWYHVRNDIVDQLY